MTSQYGHRKECSLDWGKCASLLLAETHWLEIVHCVEHLLPVTAELVFHGHGDIILTMKELAQQKVVDWSHNVGLGAKNKDPELERPKTVAQKASK